MSEHVYAPFTPEQVAVLNKFQSARMMHPFTCAHRGQEGHQFRWGDVGVLVAQPQGMYCPDCGYLQNWVHDFMVDPEFVEGYQKELRNLLQR